MKCTELVLGLLCAALLSGQDFKRTEDVVYGRKFGTALTMDVIEAAQPNGIGIIFVVSGGWRSNHASIVPKNFGKLLERGYTVFAVVPSSQPRFTISEISEDVKLALSFIKSGAARWKIDPQKLGISGFSAGCHLSLMVATQSKDAVQAVACFFPPTDFLNWGKVGVNGAGVGPVAGYRDAFGAKAGTEELAKQLSPIYHVSEKTPPTLLIHGDADQTVPLQQSEVYIAKLKEAGVRNGFVVVPGKGHGWPTIYEDFTLLADWFDEYLRGVAKVAN